jgi:hypothetical protein
MDAADDITKFAVAESIARQKQRGTNRTIPYRLDEVSTGAPRGHRYPFKRRWMFSAAPATDGKVAAPFQIL